MELLGIIAGSTLTYQDWGLRIENLLSHLLPVHLTILWEVNTRRQMKQNLQKNINHFLLGWYLLTGFSTNGLVFFSYFLSISPFYFPFYNNEVQEMSFMYSLSISSMKHYISISLLFVFYFYILWQWKIGDALMDQVSISMNEAVDDFSISMQNESKMRQ